MIGWERNNDEEMVAEYKLCYLGKASNWRLYLPRDSESLSCQYAILAAVSF